MISRRLSFQVLRFSAACAALCVIVGFSSQGWASAYFTWTDENGVVHFSATPPESTQEEARIEEISLPGQGAQRSSGHRPSMQLEDTWWTRGSGGASRFITFQHGNFTMGEVWLELAGRRRVVYATGPYEYKDGQLVLTYFSNSRDAYKLDTDERFSVTRLDAESLVLLGADNADVVGYQRLVRSHSGDAMRPLLGRWRDSRNSAVTYEFLPGVFHVEGRRQTGGVSRIRSGNWQWDDPFLLLTPVLDMHLPVDGLRPVGLRWQILEQTIGEIRIHDQDQGVMFSLVRQ